MIIKNQAIELAKLYLEKFILLKDAEREVLLDVIRKANQVVLYYDEVLTDAEVAELEKKLIKSYNEILILPSRG
jgi:CO dehydrogenase/acetyl-CoA synthase epsilon subunit